ncbi:unnamed protein product [Aureobasidium uvarum]|uniref:Uncharacterized protein n=1 Tax=Aureobasidium uvarum TaxID=2773716 RepID=A0A9N8KU52_9PEZI|nr:unnamed protein product [Aureobasidium uvarum]
MAQSIPVPPTYTYFNYTMPSEYPQDSDDFLVNVIEGSDSEYDARLSKKTNSVHRKKHVATIQTTLHCWKLTKAAPKIKDGAPSWKRAERAQMTLPSDELELQAKKQRKARSLTEMYETLSTDQRQQVEVLIQEQRRNEVNKYARWEIAAIHREVLNNLRTRIRETTFIRVILSRDDKRKAEKTATEHGASVASNISDLNDLSDLSLKQTETGGNQRLPPKRREFQAQSKAKKAINENVIEVLPDPGIGSAYAVNVPSLGSPLPSDRLRSHREWSNDAPLWYSPSAGPEHEAMPQNQLNQWRPQQDIELQRTQQGHHVQNALAYITSMNQNARTQVQGQVYEDTCTQSTLPEPWLSQQSPLKPRAFGYNPHGIPIQQQFEKISTHETSPHLEPQRASSSQDYFGQQFGNQHEIAAKPSFAGPSQIANNNRPALVTADYTKNPEAYRGPPSTKIQISDDTDWPSYNPNMEQLTPPLPQLQQHLKQVNHSAERLRREDVLFWRTQAQLSHSRSSSSLDDQSSTMASPEQSSPPTSVSGDGMPPHFRYDARNDITPGRFGQQLAAHDFLRPNQTRQQEQIPVLPQRRESEYRPATRRGVSFEDEPFEIPDRQYPPQPVQHTFNPSMYHPDNYTRPSAPDPPEPKVNAPPYHPHRYQPRQHTEPENTSMLERLNERLDHMELRQAEGATRRAVEAAQKRRELERKEAYEKGVEDAMAWKARSGDFGNFG